MQYLETARMVFKSPGDEPPLPDPDSVRVIRRLPGSTGPHLVEDVHGQQWVRKTGPGADQLRNEEDANSAYRAAGVAVPHSGIVETARGPVKFSKFMPDAIGLNEWEHGKSHEEKAEMYGKIGRHMATDALLANHDVIGLEKDNVMIRGGEPVRVDNGGALKFRAMGAPKRQFNGHVGELGTFRDPSINAQSAEVFGHVADEDLHSQIRELAGKREAILGAIKDPSTRGIVSQRLDHMESMLPE